LRLREGENTNRGSGQIAKTSGEATGCPATAAFRGSTTAKKICLGFGSGEIRHRQGRGKKGRK
jgi:hypothetical protein